MGVPRGKGYDQGIWPRHRVSGLRRRCSETRDVYIESHLNTAPIVSAVLPSVGRGGLRCKKHHNYVCVVCGATTLAGRFSQVRHADAGRKGGVRLCHPPDGLPQPPLLFCDTLPDCSVILGLSPNYSPFFVAHFYAFAVPTRQIPYLFAHSHVASSGGRFLDFVRARCVRSLLLLPPGSGHLTHFVIHWHTVQ